MIRSMTGYGSAELERDGQRLAAEIRSVNHRFCEVSVRAPKLVSLFEDQIRQLIQDRFSRGKLNLIDHLERRRRDRRGPQGERRRGGPLRRRCSTQLREPLPRSTADLDLRTLATLPDVFTWEHTALSDEETWELVKTLVEQGVRQHGRR